jgi:hypothetical protein
LRLAQRGVPVNALVRAYRLGQEEVLRFNFAEINRQCTNPTAALIATQHVVTTVFTYIDWISQQVVTVYEAEREQWLANRNTVRVARIHEIIEGKELDHETAESAIGHPLRQYHLGVIAWTVNETPAPNFLARLENLITALAREIADVSRPLFFACDRFSGWGWLPMGRTPAAVDATALIKLIQNTHVELRVALGSPGFGLTGFRDTHRQARQAQRVAHLAGQLAAPVTSYTEPAVRAAGLLSENLESTRILVQSALGSLAIDDPHRARLRETLLAFYSTGNNYTASAEVLNLHKNSVKYRLSRAAAEIGQPIDPDRLDIELALMACRWFGNKVLRQPHD